MAEFTAGQNSELASYELLFSVQPARVNVAALLLDDQRRAVPDGYVDASGPSRRPGVEAEPGRLSVNLDAVGSDISRILCVVLDPQPRTDALFCTLTDDRGQTTGFTVAAADAHPAVIGFELYRRAQRWKVRAVGQGYAGGVTDLARAHGLPVSAPPEAPPAPAAAPPSAAAPSPVAVPITPLGDQDPLERISMIYEDAARSTAALLTAHDFADHRRDTEMTAAVADPTTRNTAVGQHAMAEAQRRYDELIAAATSDYRRDAAHLIAELDALDGQLPSALAPWAASAWQQPPRPATGIRLGVVTVPEAGPLAVPLCVPAPMRRPVWIDTREPGAAAPVLASLLTRLVAAAPHSRAEIDVIDLADTLGPLTMHLQAHMPRPTVTAHTDVGERLHHLVTVAELAALHDGPDTPPAAGGIAVITDPGYGFSPEAIFATVQLINSSTSAGISVILVGDHADAMSSTTALLRDIAECSHHIRLDADDFGILDPWTHNAWRFVPETLTPGPRLADLIGTVTPPHPDPSDPPR